jgi:hypothetical protein
MPHALTSSTGGTSEGGLSRVQLDRQGILKIQHLLHMAGKPHGMHAAQPSTVHMHMQPGSATLEVPDPSPTMPAGSLHHHGHAAPGVAGGQPQPGGGSAHIDAIKELKRQNLAAKKKAATSGRFCERSSSRRTSPRKQR